MASSLPATTERPSYGTPAFFVRDELIARFDESAATWVVPVADLTQKEVLLASDPQVFRGTRRAAGLLTAAAPGTR